MDSPSSSFDHVLTMRVGRKIIAPSESSIVEILCERARRYPDREIFCFLPDGHLESDRLTYSQLHQNACRIAERLLEQASPGDRALLMYPPGLELISGLFGCFYSGVIAVPVALPRLSWIAEDLGPLKSIADDCRPQVVLVGGEASEKLVELCRTIPRLNHVEIMTTDGEPGSTISGEPPRKVERETVAILQYTSGSTGDPRGVVLTHGNILENEFVIQSAFGHDTYATPMNGVCWLPFHHDMGLIGNVLQLIYGDGICYIIPPAILLQRPFRWLEAISRYRAHTSGGPNFAYQQCTQRVTDEQKQHLDLSCWEVAYIGSEPISPKTIDEFAEAFAVCGFRRDSFSPCYGLAEATLMVSSGEKQAGPNIKTFAVTGNDYVPIEACHHGAADLPVNNPQRRYETLVGCGHAWLDHELVVADAKTRSECPDGRVGEIWFRGASVANGYWDREQETQHAFHATLSGSGRGPFLRTGDLGFVDDGELYITGRCKDVIVIHGQNYYPQDIEQTVDEIHKCFRPHSTAAIGCQIDGEERLVVLQEVKPRTSHVDVDQLERDVRNAIAKKHHIQAYEIVFLRAGMLLKTTSGKIRRQICKDRYLQRQLIPWKGKSPS